MTQSVGVRRASIVLVAVLGIVGPVRSQTWTGASNSLWNVPSNWSSNPTLPLSGIDTALIFGAASNTVQTQNLLPNPFLLNSLTFNSAAPSYTISGNGLDFRTSSVAVLPKLVQDSANAVTLGMPLTLTNNLTVAGSGSGQVNLNGALTGAGGLTVAGGRTVLLGSGSNAFAGAVNVNTGTLLLGNGAAIPAGRNVTVASGATFNTGGLSNASGTAIDAVTLNGFGTLKIPSGSGNYFLNNLVMNSEGALLDFTGSVNSTLHFVNAGAGITVGTLDNDDNNWTGAGTSHIVNDTAAPIDINLTGVLVSSIRLANGTAGQGFRLNGPSEMFLTNTGNTANLTVDNNAYLRVTDMAFLGTGAFALANTTSQPTPGTLEYTGATASSTKPIALGSGGGQVWVRLTGTNLTLTGVISESVSGQRLLVAGNGSTFPEVTLTLTGSNTYTGPTVVGAGAILSIGTIANGGVASPLGASPAAPANLVLGRSAIGSGTLQYTGASATTNRGMTLSSGVAITAIEVTNAATNLTITGQLTGTGELTKSGPGTLTLSNATNNYTGFSTDITAGRLVIGANGAVLPAGHSVVVSAGAELNLGSFSNASGTALGGLILGGTLRVPSGGGDYYINKLYCSTVSATLDFSGSSGFDLHFVNPGAFISVASNSTWIGGSFAELSNDSGATIDWAISPGMTLTNGINLRGLGFRVFGGGTLFQTTKIDANLTVEQAKLRVDDVSLLGSITTLNGGTLQYSGPTVTTLNLPILFLGTGGGTVEVSNAATILTFTGSVHDSGALVKAGPGVLVLDQPFNTYSSGITVAAGRLDVSADDRLGVSNPTVNALGTLRYTASASTARTFNLIDGTLEAPAGVTLTLDGATVGGGFLRGAGTFALSGNTALIGVSTATSTTISQTGPASVANFTNNGSFTVPGGQTLTWNNGTNASAGRMTVNGTANVSDFVSNGLVNITIGGAMINSGSPLVLGGGSRTFIGSAAFPGGEINLGGQTLEFNGGLLVNNGTVNGAVFVNYGSLVQGAGLFGVILVRDGGALAPGNSPGILTASSVQFDNGSVAGGPLLSIELAGAALGSQYSQLNVTGLIALGGTLEVLLSGGFAPAAGSTFDILNWTTRIGTFNAMQLPALGGSLVWDTSLLYSTGVIRVSAAGVAGDYNHNNKVDAADYTVWRNSLGQVGPNLAADGNGDHVITRLDYDVWKLHFGETAPGSASAQIEAVPEPTTLVLLVGMILIGTLHVTERRRVKSPPAK